MINKEPIIIRARITGGTTKVTVLIKHPMERGDRKDIETNELIPAQFIQEVTCESAGRVVMTALWSGNVAKDPYLGFRFDGGKKGDPVKLSWVDNLGNSDSAETTIQ